VAENGSDRTITWKWLVGILVFVVFALLGSLAANIQTRLTNYEAAYDRRGERMAALESRIALVEQGFSFINSQLQKLLDNQDKLANQISRHREAEGDPGFKRR